MPFLKNWRLSAFLGIAVCVLTGCGLTPFVEPEKQAIVDEYVFFPWLSNRTGVHALSTKMERRLVVFERKEEGKDDDLRLRVCAESPAEATQALNSINKLTVELEKAGVPKGSFDSTLSTAVHAAFKRTQGLQFYRDGAYQLCQAWLNGVIKSEEKFFSHLKELEKNAVKLIGKELEKEDFYCPNCLKQNGQEEQQE